MTLAALAASQERGLGYVKGSKNALYDGPPRPSNRATASEGRRTDLTNSPGWRAASRPPSGGRFQKVARRATVVYRVGFWRKRASVEALENMNSRPS